jgi:hypothetical protein
MNIPIQQKMQKSKRMLNLSDAMILVCSTAFGLALARLFLTSVNSLMASDSAFLTFPGVRNDFARMKFTGTAICMLTFWSLALLVLNLRRSSKRHILDLTSPGAAACVSIAIVLLSEVIFEIRFIFRSVLTGSGLIFDVKDWSAPVAAAIIGSWVTLRLCGDWKRCSSWVDWSSRFIAVCWVIVAILDAILKAANENL